MSKFVTYVSQQLAASGFAILNEEIACTLRPDMFPTGMDAMFELGEADRRNAFVNLPRVTRMRLTLEGLSRRPIVLTRSLDDLARRIEQVTGFKVVSIKPEEAKRIDQGAAASEAAAVADEARAAALAERLAKTRALAAKELPAHSCASRTEIIRARQELERLGAADGIGFVPM